MSIKQTVNRADIARKQNWANNFGRFIFFVIFHSRLLLLFLLWLNNVFLLRCLYVISSFSNVWFLGGTASFIYSLWQCSNLYSTVERLQVLNISLKQTHTHTHKCIFLNHLYIEWTCSRSCYGNSVFLFSRFTSRDSDATTKMIIIMSNGQLQSLQ